MHASSISYSVQLLLVLPWWHWIGCPPAQDSALNGADTIPPDAALSCPSHAHGVAIWPSAYLGVCLQCPCRNVQEEMAKFRDLEYCKMDFIASKGILFCKYSKTSSALLALEAIMANDNMVSAARATSMRWNMLHPLAGLNGVGTEKGKALACQVSM